MNVPFVDLNAQYESIKDEIDHSIKSILEKSHFIGGPIVDDFEKSFAEFLGMNYCIGSGNGTDAMEIILQALNIGEGDEVIVPACSWIATSEVVTKVGARPVFADVLPDLYTLDPKDFEKKITSRTRAVIPVHLYGLPAEMDDIMAIADAHNIMVVEDCAQAHNAMYKGRKTGTFGIAAAFSFYPGKNLGAYGDAGAMVTNDPELARKMRMIGNHGQIGKHNHLIEGRNSRLDTIQASILMTKLVYLQKWTAERQQNAILYHQHLQNGDLQIPRVPEYSQHVYHLYVVQVHQRAKIIVQLSEAGIQTSIHYPRPLPFVKAYQYLNHKYEDFPVAARQMKRILSLPMYAELSEEQIDYVCDTLLKSIELNKSI